MRSGTGGPHLRGIQARARECGRVARGALQPGRALRRGLRASIQLAAARLCAAQLHGQALGGRVLRARGLARRGRVPPRGLGLRGRRARGLQRAALARAQHRAVLRRALQAQLQHARAALPGAAVLPRGGQVALGLRRAPLQRRGGLARVCVAPRRGGLGRCLGRGRLVLEEARRAVA